MISRGRSYFISVESQCPNNISLLRTDRHLVAELGSGNNARHLVESKLRHHPTESDMPIVVADDLTVGEPLPGWHDRYFHSDNMSFEYYDVDEGSSIHEHSHDEEEVLKDRSWSIPESMSGNCR